MSLPPPRISVIVATDAPIAAVIAQTSGWMHVARWNLDDGTVDAGGWHKGKVYARRAGLSPDGRWLYYFALKGGDPFHAVSRLPWVTALALWRDNSTYGTGCTIERVEGDQRGSGGMSDTPSIGTIAPLWESHRMRLVGYRNEGYARERHLGWREHPDCEPRAATDTFDEHRRQVLYRDHGRSRLVLSDDGISRDPGAIEYRKPRYRLERNDIVTELVDVTWADWDHRGRLLVATTAGALQIRNPANGHVLHDHDLAAHRPDPKAPPPEARDW